jgi:hypothetical protein
MNQDSRPSEMDLKWGPQEQETEVLTLILFFFRYTLYIKTKSNFSVLFVFRVRNCYLKNIIRGKGKAVPVLN